MKKRGGLLYGLNYEKSYFPTLRGCENDMYNFKNMLVTDYGWESGDLKCNSETSKDEIIDELKKAISTYENIWFSFSGHGWHSKNTDKFDTEVDGEDECLVMSKYSNNDMYLYDDTIFQIIQENLQDHQKMFCIIDTCHSGTMVDLEYIYNKTNLKINNNKNIKGKVISFSGCTDSQQADDIFINKDQTYGAMSHIFQKNVKGFNINEWFDGMNVDKQFITLCNNINDDLKKNNHSQISRLSSSYKIGENNTPTVITDKIDNKYNYNNEKIIIVLVDSPSQKINIPFGIEKVYLSVKNIRSYKKMANKITLPTLVYDRVFQQNIERVINTTLDNDIEGYLKMNKIIYYKNTSSFIWNIKKNMKIVRKNIPNVSTPIKKTDIFVFILVIYLLKSHKI